MFKDHDVKINYISRLIDIVRTYVLPVNRQSMDRTKVIEELGGRFLPDFGQSELNEIDEFSGALLNFDNKLLLDIKRERMDSLYVSLRRLRK